MFKIIKQQAPQDNLGAPKWKLIYVGRNYFYLDRKNRIWGQSSFSAALQNQRASTGRISILTTIKEKPGSSEENFVYLLRF